jgi:hypothetical protein
MNANECRRREDPRTFLGRVGLRSDHNNPLMLRAIPQVFTPHKDVWLDHVVQAKAELRSQISRSAGVR